MTKKNYAKDTGMFLIDVAIWLVLGIVLVMGLEIIHAQSIRAGVKFVYQWKNATTAAYMIVLLLTSPCLLFKRSHFVFGLIAVPMTILTVVAGVVSVSRGIPMMWSDFYNIADGMAVAGSYVSGKLLMAVAVLIILIIVVLFVLYKLNGMKLSRLWLPIKMGVFVVVAIGLTMGVSNFDKSGKIDPILWDSAIAYKTNGFIYSFTHSMLATIRTAPDGYNEKSLKTIEQDIKTVQSQQIPLKEKPNVIMVQLEAFMDPTILEGVQFSSDPIPNFRKYFKENWSGHMDMPTFGGGTARSEFEVLTGVNLDYLSPGEIPHTSGLLGEKPIESMGYILKEHGYTTTAIHNFQGNFYNRNTVFTNLGFDHFISKEYMAGIQMPKGWPKDDILPQYIDQTLKATEGRDFIYTITVETHGGYNKDYQSNNSRVKVTGGVDQSVLNETQEYVDRLVEVDDFIGSLTEYVKKLDEPTVLVMFSDHFPSMTLAKEAKEKYTVPYVITGNVEIPKVQDHHIEAYELSAQVLDLIGMNTGYMSAFHTAYEPKEDYKEIMKLAQYDMLFGKSYLTSGKELYAKTDMKMGVVPIEIKNIELDGNQLKVIGDNFTEDSKIYIENDSVATKFVSPNTLMGDGVSEIPKEVSVGQIGRHDRALTKTEPYKEKE
ncbi:MAG: LTA synthase family protein [Cellulosilyticaceae bacterium]